VLIIIIPGIAMAGILRDEPLGDPDLAYLTLVNRFVPAGIRGLILCGLFASLMSTLDSIYNSVGTLWSIDIYKRYVKPEASDAQVVRAGKLAIVASLVSGLLFGFVVVYVKFGNPGFPLTHWFNELTYYVKNGFVLLVLAAVFLLRPSRRIVLFTLLFSIVLTYLFKVTFTDMNYFVRSSWVILLSFAVVAVPTVRVHGWRPPEGMLFVASRPVVARFGWALALSLLVCHVAFH